jgi:hypothetical protein
VKESGEAESMVHAMNIPLSDPRAAEQLDKLEFDIRPISRPIVPFLVIAEEAARTAAAAPAGEAS